MGILSTIGNWVSEYVPVVAEVVKKAAEVVYNAADYVKSLVRGKDIIRDMGEDEYDKENGSTKTRRPDVMGDEEGDNESIFTDLAKRIDRSKNKLLRVEKNNDLDHKKIKLQIDIMELMISAQTVERFTNNINLHAANLQIHLQTIQNTAGLLINVTGNKGVVDPIEGIDIDMRPGSISIYGAYEAFDNTREMLLREVGSYSEALNGQVDLIENIRDSARKDPRSMKRINSWIEDSIEPSLASAKKHVDSLKGDLIVIPKLESNLR